MSQNPTPPQPATPEKLDLRSHTIADDKVQELLRLFPEIRTEGGKLDFDRLKLALGQVVDVGRERYGMNWPGKADCFKTIQAPSVGTLRPCPEESVNFDTTENLIIEGDNLEVLKLLQKSYLGKVKMIYIDPPYNTGNDFIYPDNFAESLDTYLEYTGQVDAEGKKFGTNTDTDGRFHSKWMNMMYPRLYLARNLLRDDGFLVASIDDAEFPNIRVVLNEVFGEENLIAVLVWDRNRKNDAKFFSVGHEYMVVYARDKARLGDMDVVLRAQKEGVEQIHVLFDELRKKFKNNFDEVNKHLKHFFQQLPEDSPLKPLSRYSRVDEKGPYRDDGNINWPGGGGPLYEILHPTTHKPCKQPRSGWRYPTPERFWEEYDAGRIVFGADETTVPRVRSDLFTSAVQVLSSVAYSYAQTAAQQFDTIFDGVRVFDNPKPYGDLAKLAEYLSGPEDIVLDFFAGSGSAGHAVLESNCSTGAKRRFILVQLPEIITDSTETGRNARKLGLSTVADICKERVRRVIKQLNEADEGKLKLDAANPQDRGFRVFKLDQSNFTAWDAGIEHEPKVLAEQLQLHIKHTRDERTADDILYELLLKSGFPLTTPVEKKTLAGKTIYAVAGGAMVICLERELTLELIRAIADAKPQRVVLLDEGFAANDQLKANAVQTFKTKGVTSFKTV